MDDYPEDDRDTDAEQERKAEDQDEHFKENPCTCTRSDCQWPHRKPQDISDTSVPQRRYDTY